MPTTAKRPKASVLKPNPPRLQRFTALIERATEHFTRRPEHVNAVRQGKCRPIHERQLAENMTLIAQGYRRADIVAGLEMIIIEVEDATDDPSTNGHPFPSMAEAYQDAVDAESAAAPWQHRASMTGEIGDIDRALERMAHEIATEKRHYRTLQRRRETLALLRRQSNQPMLRAGMA